MRPRLLAGVLAAVVIVGGSAAFVVVRLSGSSRGGHAVAVATPAASSPSPSPAPTAATPTPAATPSSTPTASPSPAVADACASSQLNMVVGAGSSSAGGQRGVTVLIGNEGAAACDLSGTLQARLLSAAGASLSTSQGAVPAGEAWLVPDRVALDPWEPQPGEATVLISWHTGDTAPGVCSGSAPVAGELGLTVPGGGSITAPVNPSPSLPEGMAPCRGVLTLGAITQVSSAATFTTNAQDAAVSEIEEEEGVTVTSSCTPAPGQSCLTLVGETSGTGTDAADFEYQSYGTGGGAVCYAYVYQDAAGWHPLDVLCTQDTAPADGSTVVATAPGGGCVDVHSAPGHASSVLSCVSSSSATTYEVEQGPVYVAETDSTTHLPMGTIWWYLTGPDGWVAQDFVAGANG